MFYLFVGSQICFIQCECMYFTDPGLGHEIAHFPAHTGESTHHRLEWCLVDTRALRWTDCAESLGSHGPWRRDLEVLPDLGYHQDLGDQDILWVLNVMEQNMHDYGIELWQNLQITAG